MAAAPSSTLTPLPPIRPTSIPLTSTLISSAAASSLAASPTSSPSASPTTNSTSTDLNAGTYIILIPPCSAWSCWTPSEHDAVIVSVAILGVAMMAVMVYVGIMYRKRRKRVGELEGGPEFQNASGKGTLGVWWKGKAKRNGNILRAGKGKGRARSRSRSQNRARGIEGLEDIELGPAAARSLFESGGAGLGTSRGAVDGGEGFVEGEGMGTRLQEGGRQGVDKGVRGQEERSHGRFVMD